MTRRRGFTLIELLVVIAIIGILAAMLFPVFARARESARKIQCLSNVKNIAMAVQMYLTDYDKFPPNGAGDAGFTAFLTSITSAGDVDFYGGCKPWYKWNINPYLKWPVVLDEYIKNRDVWYCGSIQYAKANEFSGYARFIVPQYTSPWWKYLEENTDRFGWRTGLCPGGVPVCTGGCGGGAYPSGWGGSVTDFIAQQTPGSDETGAFRATILANAANLVNRSTAAIDDPTQWIVCQDSQTGTTTLMGTMVWMQCPKDWGFTSSPACEDWYYDINVRKKYAPHMGGLNIGFADGHAKWWTALDAIREAGSCECCSWQNNYEPYYEGPSGVSGSYYYGKYRKVDGEGKLRGVCPSDYSFGE